MILGDYGLHIRQGAPLNGLGVCLICPGLRAVLPWCSLMYGLPTLGLHSL